MTKKKKIDRSKLPVYEIVIDPNDNTSGVKMVSLLNDPAIEVKGQYFFRPTELITPPCHYTWDGTPNCQCIIVDDEWTLGDNPCEFCLENKEKWDAIDLRFRAENKPRWDAMDIKTKQLLYSKFKSQQFHADAEKKLIIAPVLIPNKKIFRRDPDTGNEYYVVFTPEVITQIAEKFNKGNNNRSINLDHTNEMAPAFLRENWLVADPVYDKSKVYGYDLPVNTWVWLLKIEDDTFWQTQVKELGKYSLSVEGLLGQKLMQFALNEQELTGNLFELLSDNDLFELAIFTIEKLHK